MPTSSVRLGARILSLAALATVLPGFAQDASHPRCDGPDRTRKLAAAAQKEGSFALYTSFAEKDLPPLTAAFEKKYGVKVKVWRAGSEKVVQRTLAEASAQRHEVDAIHSSALEMEALHREKILQPVGAPRSVELIAGALRPHGEWIATYLSIWVQAYNTRLIAKADLPRTFRDLVARNGISVRSGHSLLNNMVVAGEVPLALTMYQFLAEAAKRKGAAVDWFVMEPAVARMSGVGIARRAPHPNAALLFYDFMLSVEAQKVLQSLDYVPTNAQVPSPFAAQRFTLVDPAVALDQGDKWRRSFEEVILKQGGRH